MPLKTIYTFILLNLYLVVFSTWTVVNIQKIREYENVSLNHSISIAENVSIIYFENHLQYSYIIQGL